MRQVIEVVVRNSRNRVNYGHLFTLELIVQGLARTRLAKSILDCAWSQFLQIFVAALAAFPPCDGGKLCSERVKRGKRTVEVSARGSSIECSSCGTRVEKTLKDRIHECPSCLLSIDRDWNSALVLLERGLAKSCYSEVPSRRQTFQDRTVGLPFSGCRGLGDAQSLKQQFSVVRLEAPVKSEYRL